MTEHDRIRHEQARTCDRDDLESLSDAIRGLQSTDDPSLVPLHDELLRRYNQLNVKPALPMPRLKCIWCMKRTATNPCEHCGSDQVYDMDALHTCHWSRKTMAPVECKICERVIPTEEYLKHAAS